MQLYSLATPNGVKVTVMLEELLAAGHKGAEYNVWLIQIGEGDQFGSGFVGVNPNSKIPALMDYSEAVPQRVFESGAILLYLADKFDAFLPKDRAKRTEALNWLFWQMGSTPYLGGGFGHFYAYAPVKIKYAIDRFTMELKRQLDVLDRQLADKQFIVGNEYTIADMAIRPWYGNGVMNGASYNDPRQFLQTHEYKNLMRWTKEIGEHPHGAGGWSTARTGHSKDNCVNATMLVISKQGRRTRSAGSGNPATSLSSPTARPVERTASRDIAWRWTLDPHALDTSTASSLPAVQPVEESYGVSISVPRSSLRYCPTANTSGRGLLNPGADQMQHPADEDH